MLLVKELVHDLNRYTRGNNVVLKLDVAKAYDRMSWPFIIQMLRCFGFSKRWVSLIQCAIYGPWFSILANRVSHGYFQSQGGLRQGNPLSLFFFITTVFLSQGLDNLYYQFSSVRYFSPALISISHLSFADDIFNFTNGSRSSLQQLMDFLHHYEAILRQFQAKSNFYIGGSASASHQDIVHSVTGFQWHQLSFIYLRCLVFT